jgi:hypothetical protein
MPIRPFKLLLLILLTQNTIAQNRILKGIVKDAHSDERIPFASMQFKSLKTGKLSDSAGSFIFRFHEWPSDTLIISYVGYQDFKLPLDSFLLQKAKNNVLDISILMERGKFDAVVVKRKIDRGLLMWKRIVKHKAQNDRYRFRNFSYELYNKLEVDLKNIKREKWENLPFIKKFNFVLNNIDTTEEGVPYLPVYITEALSDYYYQKSPLRRREVFKGTKTMGVNNESVSKLLGGIDQNVNFYANFIPVFDKQFVSPISDNGDAFYNYKVLDSQFVNGRRLIHFFFIPKHKGQNTFEGDCWVHDTTFAIQKMNLRLGKDANLNYVNRLSLIQEFALLNDSTWFLTRDKFVVDLSLLSGEKLLSAIGRKTTTYKDIVVNDTSVTNELAKNKLIEETIFPPQANNAPDSFWVQNRHEELTATEKKLYQTIDTLLKLPAFQRAVKTVNFLATGYLDVGNFEIGPWYNWIFSNVLEGWRFRWDLGTNRYFSKRLHLHGYLAYGTTDQKFKYEADAMWLFNKNPRSYIFAKYSKDIDYGQNYLEEVSQDNIFALAVRKNGVPIKFLKTELMQLDLYKEWHSGLSVTLSGVRKLYDPLLNLPSKEIFDDANGGATEPLNTFEASVQVRFAYLEKFLEGTFSRYSMGSPYPITTIKYTRGIKGMLNSHYEYSKLTGSISDYLKISPYGSLYYNVFAGRTFGTLPFMLLDVAPGNEIYYYNKYAYSLMNRWQYLHDKYAGFNFEHNIGSGIFRFTQLTRRLKFRQFYTVKGLWGSLNEENRALNMPAGSEYKFESLDGKTYLEIGTGVDNIFKVFRFDFVWRLLPQPLPEASSQRFGVFGSFRLQF